MHQIQLRCLYLLAGFEEVVGEGERTRRGRKEERKGKGGKRKGKWRG